MSLCGPTLLWSLSWQPVVQQRELFLHTLAALFCGKNGISPVIDGSNALARARTHTHTYTHTYTQT